MRKELKLILLKGELPLLVTLTDLPRHESAMPCILDI